MRKGNLKIELNLDYIEYTGKEKDKKVFFDRLAKSVCMSSKELLDNNIVFFEDGSFEIRIKGKSKFQKEITEKANIYIGNIIIFLPPNNFYNNNELLPFNIYEDISFNIDNGYELGYLNSKVYTV